MILTFGRIADPQPCILFRAMKLNRLNGTRSFIVAHRCYPETAVPPPLV
ncbi:MAG: hypothetical protein JWN98_1905 [Abditibacteriota bacterium]|nr:hypothetical protein [Abditibacteriota bacterium]